MSRDIVSDGYTSFRMLLREVDGDKARAIAAVVSVCRCEVGPFSFRQFYEKFKGEIGAFSAGIGDLRHTVGALTRLGVLSKAEGGKGSQRYQCLVPIAVLDEAVVMIQSRFQPVLDRHISLPPCVDPRDPRYFDFSASRSFIYPLPKPSSE